MERFGIANGAINLSKQQWDPRGDPGIRNPKGSLQMSTGPLKGSELESVVLGIAKCAAIVSDYARANAITSTLRYRSRMIHIKRERAARGL